MTIDQRAWATELAEGWHGTESRAFTVHHPGQITLSQYETLDRVEPQELTTPQYLVRTGPTARRVGYLGQIEGGLAGPRRTARRRPKPSTASRCLAGCPPCPTCAVVDDRTDFAFPDPRHCPRCSPSRAKVMDVPPLDASHAPESERAEDQDEEADQPPT